MKHLSEEQLILYHYGEADDPRGLEAHLAACKECRATFQSLHAMLVAIELPVPERDDSYGRQLWARLAPHLATAPAGGWRWSEWWQPRRWALAGAVVTLVLAAFLLGRFWPRPAEVAQPIPPQVRERILLVAVGDHLERSEMVLIELMNTEGNGGVDISPEQARAGDLVEENRLYRLTAERAGEVGVASVLEELERVLLEIANSPSHLSSPELAQFRRRLEAKGILFKVRVIGSQVREREKSVAPEPDHGRT